MRLEQVAELLGVDRATVWRWRRKANPLPAVFLPGGCVRVHLAGLERWIAEEDEAARRGGTCRKKTCGETVFMLTTCGQGVRIPDMNMRRFDSEAAETLRAALGKTGLGVREIAERADISAGIVSRFLVSARTLTLPTADRLAAAVGLQWRLVKPRKAR